MCLRGLYCLLLAHSWGHPPPHPQPPTPPQHTHTSLHLYGKRITVGGETHPIPHLYAGFGDAVVWTDSRSCHCPLLSFREILDQLDLMSSDDAQSMMSAVCRIHNGLKVVFCFRHATASHYHHHADLLTCIWHIKCNIPTKSLNACWV